MKHFFVPSAKKTLNLNSSTDNGCDFVCWPVNEERSDANTIVIEKDKRCSCTTRIKYIVQCQHELLHDGCFKSAKYDTRWYNRKYYEDNVDCNINQIIEAPSNVCIDIAAKEQDQSDDSLIDVYSKNPTTAVTYTDLTKICHNLISLVSHDSKKSNTVLSVLSQWVDYIKSGVDVNVTVNKVMNITTSSSNIFTDGNLDSAIMNLPTASTGKRKMPDIHSDLVATKMSVGTQNKATVNSVRKKSWVEYNTKRTKRKQVQNNKVLLSSNLKTMDKNIIGETTMRTYGCKICHQVGHRYKYCPKIIVHGQPLDLKSREQRELLCDRLISSRCDVLVRDSTDQRTVMISTPKKVIGVIIHNRYWKRHHLKCNNDPSDMSLECTFIKYYGEKVYCSTLFQLSSICSYFTKSVTNIVVLKL